MFSILVNGGLGADKLDIHIIHLNRSRKAHLTSAINLAYCCYPTDGTKTNTTT